MQDTTALNTRESLTRLKKVFTATSDRARQVPTAPQRVEQQLHAQKAHSRLNRERLRRTFARRVQKGSIAELQA